MAADYKVPAYTLYIDTSVAHSRKPSEPISGKLRKWTDRAKTLTSVEIRVPEVVIEELTYQQFAIAQAAAENRKKNTQTLKDVCGVDLPALPTPDRLKEAAREVMAETISQLSLLRIPTPVQSIDWAAVIADSCWRNPPFEKPPSSDDLAEKGFRDKIAL